MKGEIVTYIPAELASAAQDRVVSSAEGIYDYRLKDNQENINKQVQEQIDNIETIPGDIVYPTFKIDKQMHLIMYKGSDRIQREGSHLIINFENE